MKTAIVILNWNGEKYLKEYLSGIKASLVDYDASLIVADNASSDGSLQWLEENHPDVRQIRLDKNYGFTGGYNRAFDILASEQEYEYYLLLNSDVEVTDNWLYPLEEWMDLHEDCAVCGPKLHGMVDKDEFEYSGAAGGFLDSMCYPFCNGRMLDKLEKDHGQYDMPGDVLWICGACMMVRAKVWHQLKGLCEEFFAHMEEIDFCWRCRLSGWKVSIVPRSLVYHFGGGALPRTSSDKLYLNYRNNLLAMARNLPYHQSLKVLYEMMMTLAKDFEVSHDDIINCLQAFSEQLDRKMQTKLVLESAKSGLQDARSIIRHRMFFDRLSRLVYFFKGEKEYAAVVKKAHKDFKMMREEVSVDELCKYLTQDLTLLGKFARTSLDFYPDSHMLSRVEKKCISDEFLTLMSYFFPPEED